MGKKFDFNFMDVTYKFYSDEYPCKIYSIEELHPSHIDINDPELGRAQDCFVIYNESLRRDFLTILRLWRMDKFANFLKKESRRQYEFSQTDLDLVIELLSRYRNNRLWKREIRKGLKNVYFYELFFSSEKQEQLLAEARFVKSIFLHLYESRKFSEQENNALHCYLDRVLPLDLLEDALRSQKIAYMRCNQLVTNRPESSE